MSMLELMKARMDADKAAKAEAEAKRAADEATLSAHFAPVRAIWSEIRNLPAQGYRRGSSRSFKLEDHCRYPVTEKSSRIAFWDWDGNDGPTVLSELTPDGPSFRIRKQGRVLTNGDYATFEEVRDFLIEYACRFVRAEDVESAHRLLVSSAQ